MRWPRCDGCALKRTGRSDQILERTHSHRFLDVKLVRLLPVVDKHSHFKEILCEDGVIKARRR